MVGRCFPTSERLDPAVTACRSPVSNRIRPASRASRLRGGCYAGGSWERRGGVHCTLCYDPITVRCHLCFILGGLFLSVGSKAGAQTSKILDVNRHGWFSYSGEHAVKGKWGIHFDAQWRRAEVVKQWQQYQLRPGLNYQASPNVLLTLGYVYTRTYPYGEFPVRAAFPEHRIYQQALIRQPSPSILFQHRLRLEQRFIRYPNSQPVHWTYQNRFRYLLKGELPVTRRADGSVEWYIPAFNEILLGIPPNFGFRVFDQNRIFVGIGHTKGSVKVEAGYLNQFLGQRNGRIFEFNNTLFMTVTSSFKLGGLFGD
jgi:hypothetical protein